MQRSLFKSVTFALLIGLALGGLAHTAKADAPPPPAGDPDAKPLPYTPNKDGSPNLQLPAGKPSPIQGGGALPKLGGTASAPDGIQGTQRQGPGPDVPPPPGPGPEEISQRGAARALGAACCKPAPAFIEKIVTCYRREWRERDVPCTINRVASRIVVTPHTCTVQVPVWTDQKQIQTVYTRVPRQVEHEIACCRQVPVCVTDPCTGCSRTCFKPEFYTRKVCCTEFETVPVQREVCVRVCTYRPEVRTYETRECIPEIRPETIIRKERFCVTVPYQTVVRVPVCLAALSCCR
jgi:hypothetical protein